MPHGRIQVWHIPLEGAALAAHGYNSSAGDFLGRCPTALHAVAVASSKVFRPAVPEAKESGVMNRNATLGQFHTLLLKNERDFVRQELPIYHGYQVRLLPRFYR